MRKTYKDNLPITAKKFMEEFRRFQNGSVSRRHFMGVTGLGTAMAVLGAAVPGLMPRNAYAYGELGVPRLVPSSCAFDMLGRQHQHVPKTVRNRHGYGCCRERPRQKPHFPWRTHGILG